MEDKKDKAENKSKKKRNLIILGVILGAVLVVVLIGVCIMIPFFGEKGEKIKFKYDWQEKYYNFIKADLFGQKDVAKEERLQAVASVSKMVNPKMLFLELGLENPVMVIKSEEASEKMKDQVDECYQDGSLAIYGIAEDGVAGNIYCGNSDLVYMYNMESKDYGWYVEKIDKIHYTYAKVEDVVETTIDPSSEEKQPDDYEYRFNAEEKDVLDKVAEKLVKIEDVALEGTPIDKNFEKKDLQEAIVKTTDVLKEEDSFVTEKVKNQVADTLKKIEEEKKAQEEAKKKEEEEKKRVEEEQKAQSTTSNQSSEGTENLSGVKVGDKTLTYGRYVSVMQEAYIEIVLNEGGTCTYKGVAPDTGSGNYDTTCTYSAKRMDVYGYGDISDAIEFVLADGKRAIFEVSRDNEFSSDWLLLTLR